MIQLQHVSKTYSNGAIGLKNINLKVEKGEFIFIVGNSGYGKSTLLKLLMKELEPTEGKIWVNGKDITRCKRRHVPKLRRSMGVVFQDFRLLPKKTIYENVAFAMEVTESSIRDIRRNVPMALSLVGLANKARAYPHELSGGEQQRAALARAIVNNPALLLADEPTGNLDPKTSWEIMKLLRDINHRGTTVMIATHDKEIVNTMQQRVVTLDNGGIIRDIKKGGYSDDEI